MPINSFPFPSLIYHYNGQLVQDAFVDHLLDMDGGFFVDVGAGVDGFKQQRRVINCASNTYYFEKNRGWNGIAIDYDRDYIDYAKESRKCCCVCVDLLDININEVLEKNNCPDVVDYLSFDVDDAQKKVLNDLDLKKYSFKIITFEHNIYLETDEALNLHKLSRQKFLSSGYDLLLKDVVLKGYGPMEDWYINSDLVKDLPPLHLDLWEGGVTDFWPTLIMGKAVNDT